MLRSVQFLHAGDGQKVGADAVYPGAHGRKQTAELLHVRLAGGVVDGGDTIGQHGRHHDVGGTCHRSLVQQHVATLETLGSAEVVCPDYGIVLKRSAKADHAVQVRVNPAAADLIAARLGEEGAAETAEERAGQHDGAAQGRALAHELQAAHVLGIHLVRLEDVLASGEPADLYAHAFEHCDQVLDIEYLGDIGDPDFLRGQEDGADDLQGFVLGSLRDYLTAQFAATFDCER